MLSRRRVLGLCAAPAASIATTSCKSRGRRIMDMPAPAPGTRLHYGQDALQFGDLRMPKGPGPHPVAIVIHGGFWRAKYGLAYAGHMAGGLTGGGHAPREVEERRISDTTRGVPVPLF